MKFIILFVSVLSLWSSISAENPCDKVPFVSRQAWGAPNNINHTHIELPVHHVFIHHTNMAYCKNQEACLKEMRNIHVLHTTKPRQWGDIGYNFLVWSIYLDASRKNRFSLQMGISLNVTNSFIIPEFQLKISVSPKAEPFGVVGGDGGVYIGRDWNAVGAHTLGMNFKAVAFSLMGDFMKSLPGENMLLVTKKLIDCGIHKGVIAKDYKLHGHRDQSCTDCPGDALYADIKHWPHFAAGPLPTYVCSKP